jgi:hypothetical protein
MGFNLFLLSVIAGIGITDRGLAPAPGMEIAPAFAPA